jgi:GxxExxY protein
MLIQGETTGRIIGAFYKVYDELGFGFLESVYRRALAIELHKEGLRVACEVATDVCDDGVVVGRYRADMLVNHRVIVETKANEFVSPAHRKQLLNYLRASAIEVGLLLHFGPRPAYQRIVYTNRPKSAPR